MNDFFCDDTLRMIVFFGSSITLVTSIITAQVSIYFYGTGDRIQGIMTVLSYIPWMFYFIYFAWFSSQGNSKLGFPFICFCSLCAGIPHCFYLKGDSKRLKTAAILGIVSVVCITQTLIGVIVFALWGYDWI